MAETLITRGQRAPNCEPGPEPRPLENGDELAASEFLRRYEAMPEIKKAELIEGIVYMPSPVRLEQHAEPDTITQMWLAVYAARTPGTRAASNATVRLDADNVPQPDSLLRLLPECGGRTRVDANGYLAGPPELIVEIAGSSAAIDLHAKLRAYRRAGVREYLVWRTLEAQFDWFVLEHDEYRLNSLTPQHLLRSPHFPGLTLAVEALLALDSARVLDVLQASLQDPAHAAFAAQLASKTPR
jgi:Uma2 family endonuclease